MSSYELAKLRKLINEELKRRRKINELLDLQTTIELMILMGSNIEKYDTDLREIIKNLLNKITVTNTNDIYVCVGSWYYIDTGYNHPHYERSSISIDATTAELKAYRNIENGLYKEIDIEPRYGVTIPDAFKTFEKEHIVLNPYNSTDEHALNGYNEVRLDFFEESYRHGQNKAVQMILKKYPRIGSFK